MNLELSWLDGGRAEVLQTDGQLAVLRSSRAAAPGQPLTAQVSLSSTTQLRLKVQGCRREADGWFRIHGRWLDLTRAVREELVGRFGNPGS